MKVLILSTAVLLFVSVANARAEKNVITGIYQVYNVNPFNLRCNGANLQAKKNAAVFCSDLGLTLDEKSLEYLDCQEYSDPMKSYSVATIMFTCI